MVSETILIWLGTMALLVDYVAIAKADNRLSAIIGHAVGLLFWIAYTISALGYRVISGGTVIDASSQALALIGLIGTLITIILLIGISFGSITDTFADT